jgi:hypothetical protein
MRHGGRVLLAVLTLYVQIKVRVATFDTNYSVTDSTQSVAASIQKLLDSVVDPVSRAGHGQFYVSDERSVSVDYLHIKVKAEFTLELATKIQRGADVYLLTYSMEQSPS